MKLPQSLNLPVCASLCCCTCLNGWGPLTVAASCQFKQCLPRENWLLKRQAGAVCKPVLLLLSQAWQYLPLAGAAPSQLLMFKMAVLVQTVIMACAGFKPGHGCGGL